MAEVKMREIGETVRARWPGVKQVAMLHRIGRLEIGEASVLIAVAAAHRGDAFDACRYAIDTLKRTVPVWKKASRTARSGWVSRAGSRMGPRDQVDRTIRRHAMLAGGETVLVAVSGGADSVALLHLLVGLAEACAPTPRPARRPPAPRRFVTRRRLRRELGARLGVRSTSRP